MDHIIVTTHGGGIFSLFHQALATIVNMYGAARADSIHSFQIRISQEHFLHNKTMFDSFFESDATSITNTNTIQIDRNRDGIVMFVKVTEDPALLSTLKTILYKNKINTSIEARVVEFCKQYQITNRTLTVHIRLTDMNTLHTDLYGTRTFDDYKKDIDTLLETYPEIDTLYVASDNRESIDKLVSLYSSRMPVISFHHEYRMPNETSDNYQFVLNDINRLPDVPVTVFTELLIGSKGGHFLGRISDVSNFIILYSDTFKSIQYVN